jgi:menaquinone-dependent protoporphyrinogen oxidase
MPETRALVVYATSEGHTSVVAERIADVLRRTIDSVDVRLAAEAPSPEAYDAVVAGGPIHAAHHARPLVHWLERHATELKGRPAALFQVSLTSVNDDAAHTQRAHDLLADLEQKTGFDPDIVGLFAGAVLYTRYGWFKRHLMRAIVSREGGDTDTTRDYDYTDWAAVEQFALDVAALVASADRAEGGKS